MFFVYVIKSGTSGKRYTGYTSDLEKRIARHNNKLPHKKTSYTYKQGENWKIIHTESFNTRSEAIRREKELKTGKGREYIDTVRS